MPLNDALGSSGAASFPTGDAVSSAANGNDINDTMGYRGTRDVHTQEILGSTGTSNTA